jgi:hypothetical protein
MALWTTKGYENKYVFDGAGVAASVVDIQLVGSEPFLMGASEASLRHRAHPVT